MNLTVMGKAFFKFKFVMIEHDIQVNAVTWPPDVSFGVGKNAVVYISHFTADVKFRQWNGGRIIDIKYRGDAFVRNL